jgi:hypothetical protein
MICYTKYVHEDNNPQDKKIYKFTNFRVICIKTIFHTLAYIHILNIYGGKLD